MYFIEVILKKILQKHTKNTENSLPEISFDGETVSDVDEALECEHIFMPIDSTGKVLACSKCGYLIKRE